MASQWDDYWNTGSNNDDDLRRQYEMLGQTATPAPQTTSTNQTATDPWSTSGQQQGQGVSGWDAAQPTSQPQQEAQPQAWSPPAGQSQAPSAGTRASADLSPYTSALDQLKTTTDARQKAVLQDQLGRQMYGDFQKAGHDVSWDGDQLVIDGRRYVIGDGTGVNKPAEATDPQAAAQQQQPNLQIGGMTYGGTGLEQQGGTRFEGFNDERALSGGDAHSAKDAFRRIVGSLGINLPPGASRDTYGGILRDQVIPALLAQGYPVAEGNGFDSIRVFSNERGWEEVDIIGDATGGDPRWWWGAQDAGGYATDPGGGAAGGGIQAPGAGTTGATGVTTSGIPMPTAPTAPEGIPDLELTAPAYTPGAIGTDDIPGRSYEAILGDLGQYSFDGFGDLSASTEPGTEALINQLLANPESLGPREIAMLQGANREEQAAMAQSLDDDLIGMGYDMGLDSSNWLASERLAGKRSRDEAIQRSNRDVEIEAAKVNQGDRRAAAQLGATYSDAVRGRNLAEAQAAESNLFNAAQLQSNNALNAARTQLDQAAAMTDRLSLRESVNQAAAQLGLDRDKVMSDFVLSKASELTQRYGIDVSQFVDLTKLRTANQEFREDLAFRLASLEQQLQYQYAALKEGGRQYDIGAGIDLAGLQQRANEFGIDAFLRAGGR